LGHDVERWVDVHNLTRGGERLATARWCSSFRCRLRGLSLYRVLPEPGALLLVERVDGRLSASIHMFAMGFDLGVVWIDGGGRVVDLRHARRWRIYLPARPARFTLEGAPAILQRAAIGDQVEFVEHAAE
jgi:hypothetical protein